MKDTKPADFTLETFNIPEFYFSEPELGSENIEIKFSPSGIYDETLGFYYLTLKTEGFTGGEGNSEKIVFSALMKTTFKYVAPIKIQDFPDYFYANSIAITYPYLRSFISSLTLQANNKLLVLPILNLTNLHEKLKESTKVLSKSEE